MQTPLEFTCKGWKDQGDIKTIIDEKIAKLERICRDVTSCAISIEQLPTDQKKNHSYHIRIDLRIPEHHEIVVIREPKKGALNHLPLATLVRDAFDATFRQAQEIIDRQHKNVKAHTREKQTPKIFREELKQPDEE